MCERERRGGSESEEREREHSWGEAREREEAALLVGGVSFANGTGRKEEKRRRESLPHTSCFFFLSKAQSVAVTGLTTFVRRRRNRASHTHGLTEV